MIELSAFEKSPHLAELRVSYRRRRKDDREQLKMPWMMLTTPYTAEQYLRSIWNADTLELVKDFVVVYLNSALEVLGWVRVATGGISNSLVDPRIVFGIALQTAASRILLAHNHPGGRLDPSEEDKAVTRRMREAGELLHIQVDDHFILTSTGYFSFSEAGLL